MGLSSYIRRIDKGETIFGQGEHSSECFVIRAGSVMLSMEHGGTEIWRSHVPRGYPLGFAALIRGTAHPYSATADANVEMIALPQNRAEKLFHENADFRVRAMHHLAFEIELLQDQLRVDHESEAMKRFVRTLRSVVRTHESEKIDIEKSELKGRSKVSDAELDKALRRLSRLKVLKHGEGQLQIDDDARIDEYLEFLENREKA